MIAYALKTAGAALRRETACAGNGPLLSLISYPLEIKIYPFNRIVVLRKEVFYELYGIHSGFYR